MHGQLAGLLLLTRFYSVPILASYNLYFLSGNHLI